MNPVAVAHSITPVQGPATSSQLHADQAGTTDEFVTLFLRTMLKDVYKSNAFGSAAPSMYQEMYQDMLIRQLAESDAFQLKSLLESSLRRVGHGQK